MLREQIFKHPELSTLVLIAILSNVIYWIAHLIHELGHAVLIVLNGGVVYGLVFKEGVAVSVDALLTWNNVEMMYFAGGLFAGLFYLLLSSKMGKVFTFPAIVSLMYGYEEMMTFAVMPNIFLYSVLISISMMIATSWFVLNYIWEVDWGSII